MPGGSIGLARWLRGAALAVSGLAIVFIILGALGEIGAVAAAAAWAGSSLITALALRAYMHDLAALGQAAEAGTLSQAEPKSTAKTEMGRAAETALVRLCRAQKTSFGTLETARSELERAFDALPDPLLLLDKARKVLRANRAAKELLGGDIAGRDLAAALRNPDLLAAIEAAGGGEAGHDVEITLTTPIERVFAARIEPLAARHPAGAAESTILLALVDLTAIRRTEQMRADFVANASHEIRTPLATLIGFIETLQGPGRDDAEARDRFLVIMDQHAKRMSRLVDDLLSLSRIEVNEHTRPTGRVDLQAILNDVRTNLEWQARARDVDVVIEIAPGLPPVVGDVEELTQVFLNLVDNAIKYGRSEGRVTVSARTTTELPVSAGWVGRETAVVAVSVKDDGEGIPREHLPRLTERFYRISTARSRELGGTGLGLAIVKHILNRHRGALEVDSKQGEGSTFTVYLQPAAEAAQPKAASA